MSKCVINMESLFLKYDCISDQAVEYVNNWTHRIQNVLFLQLLKIATMCPVQSLSVSVHELERICKRILYCGQNSSVPDQLKCVRATKWSRGPKSVLAYVSVHRFSKYGPWASLTEEWSKWHSKEIMKRN
jgi:hypothetical protein